MVLCCIYLSQVFRWYANNMYANNFMPILNPRRTFGRDFGTKKKVEFYVSEVYLIGTFKRLVLKLYGTLAWPSQGFVIFFWLYWNIWRKPTPLRGTLIQLGWLWRKEWAIFFGGECEGVTPFECTCGLRTYRRTWQLIWIQLEKNIGTIHDRFYAYKVPVSLSVDLATALTAG